MVFVRQAKVKRGAHILIVASRGSRRFIMLSMSRLL
jgi:hypothetical protein